MLAVVPDHSKLFLTRFRGRTLESQSVGIPLLGDDLVAEEVALIMHLGEAEGVLEQRFDDPVCVRLWDAFKLDDTGDGGQTNEFIQQDLNHQISLQ